LFVLAMGSAHRAGHYLWDLSQIDADSLDEAARARLEGALHDVYRTCDKAIGKVVDAAPDNAQIMLCALHGMGQNKGWNEYFDPIFELAAGLDAKKDSGGSVLSVLKQLQASAPVKAVTSRVPRKLQEPLTALWTRRMHDWTSTKLFWVSSDVNGYIRLNLKGREPEGIVEPGAEARALLEQLAAGFMGLRDLDSGEPIASHVDIIDDITGPVSPMRDYIPDLVVQWADLPQQRSRGARNQQGNERHWPKGRLLRSGRSGNHRRDGWAVLVGDDLPANTDHGTLPAINLAPTLATWLGMEIPDNVDGQPLVMEHEPA
ncbi:MAG: hypothetical protein AAFW76_04870, partial [Pseudomonadota bacterium]